jgi:hypothetical protein
VPESPTLSQILTGFQNTSLTVINGRFYTAVCIATLFIVCIDFSNCKNSKSTVLRVCECVAVKGENARKILCTYLIIFFY